MRHLRPVQFYGRLWYRFVYPKPDITAAPKLRRLAGNWVRPALKDSSLSNEGEFLIMGERGMLSDVGWDGPSRDKLWRYNQHYFNDLNSKGSETRHELHRILITDWIEINPPGCGTGWESYPTSLRIVNWIKWELSGNSLQERAISSLAVQVRWLFKRLEWHLLGNHLFSNAKALIFAGLFFSGSEAEKWLQKGLKILEREISEQILPDGGHFELSPMYHALAVEDILDLINIASAYDLQELAEACRKHIPAMFSWLHTMSHPDGSIAFFNDAAFGVAPENSELSAYAQRMGFSIKEPSNSLIHLRESGYVRMVKGDAIIIADIAKVGPDYLPGHAHADTLSFELSIAGRRMIVNSGISVYGTGPERQRQRGTSAHNTVVVDGANSSEVWGGFRVARRARPFVLAVEQDSSQMRVECSHDGYCRLPGRPVHNRLWVLRHNRLRVRDLIEGGFRSAEALYHFHPRMVVTLKENGTGKVRMPGGMEVGFRVVQGQGRLEASTYHPEFNISIDNTCLAVSFVGREAEVFFENLGT